MSILTLRRYQIGLLAACMLLFTACFPFLSGPAPTEVPLITVPTTAVTLDPSLEPTEEGVTTVDATGSPTEVALVQTPQSIVTPTVTPVEPISVDCQIPSPPEGVFYLSYVVQTGDTLFEIGQTTRPSMSVDDLVAANCLVNPNQIDAGQVLNVWHSPSTGIADSYIEVDWQPVLGPGGGLGIWSHQGVISGDEVYIDFEIDEARYLSVIEVDNNPIRFELVLQGVDPQVIDVSEPGDRHWLEQSVGGKQMTLVGPGEYALVLSGADDVTPYNISLVKDTYPFPVFGVPEPIQFEAGATSARLVGTNREAQVDRYRLTARAGQLISAFSEAGDWATVRLEDLNGNLIEFDLKSTQTVLPYDGEYIIFVYHATEVFFYNDYDMTLSIIDHQDKPLDEIPAAPADPEAKSPGELFQAELEAIHSPYLDEAYAGCFGFPQGMLQAHNASVQEMARLLLTSPHAASLPLAEREAIFETVIQFDVRLYSNGVDLETLFLVMRGGRGLDCTTHQQVADIPVIVTPSGAVVLGPDQRLIGDVWFTDGGLLYMANPKLGWSSGPVDWEMVRAQNLGAGWGIVSILTFDPPQTETPPSIVLSSGIDTIGAEIGHFWGEAPCTWTEEFSATYRNGDWTSTNRYTFDVNTADYVLAERTVVSVPIFDKVTNEPVELEESWETYCQT